MNRFKFSFRLTLLISFVVVVLAIYIGKLYEIQVIEAGKVNPNSSGSYTYTTRVTAARGEIRDRNGNILVGNRASFNLLLVYAPLMNSEDPNEAIRRLCQVVNERGLEIADHLPVTMEKPYEYTKDSLSYTWNSHFKTFLRERDWDADISASQLIRRLRDDYNIPEDWTEEEARQVISVRYELSLRVCEGTYLPTYVILEDVDPTSLAALTDLNIPGLNELTSTVREYHTEYAAHILGRVADMDAEEWKYYKELGYEMDAQVGKEGLEKAFEAELHGTDGLLETTVSHDGKILSERYIQQPIPGNHVELSIDINLQKLAEDSIAALVEDIRINGANSKGNGKDAEGGAVVVQSIKTGEILVCASYPTYDISSYAENFNELLEADFTPMFNRALQAPYPPGSVFKMVTTVAAIDSGSIEPDLKIRDQGIYTRFASSGYYPRCMLWTTQERVHGLISVQEALAVSCNYYFYEIGWRTGIEQIDRVAKALGLGEHTGIELPESTGYRANAETKDIKYDGYDAEWYGADTISAAIGQSENRYTPLQLCNYISALANRGTRYRATFLRRVVSADYQELLQENKPTVVERLPISDDAYNACVEGMRMAATWSMGTASVLFQTYPVAVCAKTGTAEHGSGGSDNASFVLFAPANDPEIAIAIYLEKGAQGGTLGQVAKVILDSYFSEAGLIDTFTPENQPN